MLELVGVGVRETVGITEIDLLRDLSFKLKAGERTVLVGPSGAGKTTLLRLLNRLISPTTGQLYFRQQAYSQIPVIELRRQVVLVPQDPKLLGMRVQDAIAYPLQLQNLPPRDIDQRVQACCHTLRIPNEWRERTELQLSQGQRQLVAIARALVMEPQVLILDEPTSALDFGLASYLLQVLGQLENTTILMVNHQLDLMPPFAQRVFYLENGILQQDTPAHAVEWDYLRDRLHQQQEQQQAEWEM
ncbi:ATP-binding cassette domain-containing protein [Spirulina subsalsa FACHB-351]|uniref:ATP-binding cassette domain-containing protein n=1 Tax=Spirulina subsalsa FACHB-351 TaxID=234711 RepID=A0ABT3LBQ4_9CYAN|nr:ATP-binding cassette domain-containing protein [Spirulina subsalsa]MCW6038944.1 ATP-binding cassette domain-containing protein [Spirulina subsalsa FACHB-351]